MISVTNWGMGTVGGPDVIRSGLIYMGADQIDVIIMPFTLMDPLTNGTISAAPKAQIDSSLGIANVAGTSRWQFPPAREMAWIRGISRAQTE